jgi:AcrR family transcriptional regulator
MKGNLIMPVQEENLKQKILDTAITLFAQRGFRSVSLEDIAAAADVNVATVYSIYNDKYTLIKEIIRTFYLLYHDTLRGIDKIRISDEERIRLTINRTEQFFRTHRELAAVALKLVPYYKKVHNYGG